MNLNRQTFGSLEFLVLVLGNVAAWLGQLNGSIPTTYAVWASAASAAIYAVVRGIAKVNSDGKPYWSTTEFWVALLGSIPAVVAAFQSTISPHTYGIIQGVILAFLMLSNGIRKVPSIQATPGAE